MSTVYQKLFYCLFIIGLVGITAWSWVLVDTNFTLFKHFNWTSFREVMIEIGYFNRLLSSQIYIVFILALTISSLYLIKYPPKNILLLSIVVAVIAGIFSYPALSHDLFNYIFDARIFTHYGLNPYLHKALDFPNDPMLRFMHWTHRAYPYGPTYLMLSFIPSFLGFNKFALTFFLFKSFYVVLFVISTKALLNISRRSAIIFVTSPLIIVEGLINSHNDFVALTFGLIGIGFVASKKTLSGGIMLVIGGLVKYLTLPTLILALPNKWKFFGIQKKVLIALILTIGLLGYLISRGEIHPWYFLGLFVFLSYFEKLFLYAFPLFTGLLLSYYPYIVGGEWGQGGDVLLKRNIVYVGALINIVFMGLVFVSKMKQRKYGASSIKAK
jgi:hypothetical protein